VRNAGVEQDTLGGRGLTGVNVGTDADVPIALDGSFTWHGEPLKPVMGKCSVGFRHTMYFFALFHRPATSLCRFSKLTR